MFSLDLRSIIYILVEILFVGGVTLALFRLRRQISLAPLYLFVGTNQFLSVVLASTIYLTIAPAIIVSPGSTVLFTASLFAILLVYLRTDIPTSRGLILGIVLANFTLTVLLWFTSYQLGNLETINLLNVPAELFTVSPRVFLSGTLLTLLDFSLVVIIYELLSLRVSWLPQPGRILLTLLVVLVFDSLAFSAVLALGEPNFGDVLRGQLVGKSIGAVSYSILLSAYLRLIEPTPVKAPARAIEDVFSILTYRERYQRVRARLKVAEEANLAKSRFLANMSHELRTPLNAIIGFTSILLERNPGEEERTFLRRVLENGKHLLELINGLLDLSKIESGRNELNIAPVDLNRLVQETVGQLQGQAVRKQLDLHLELPANPAQLETDRMRMKQILINLIGNSLKYTDQGQIIARLSADADSGRPTRIDILDTGIGIADAELESIFRPFYQEPARSRSDGGTGLGLAISRALCEQMGHRLQVSSEAGSGSQFSIVFGAPGQ